MLYLPTFAGFSLCFLIFSFFFEKMKRNSFEEQIDLLDKEMVWKEILNGLPQGVLILTKETDVFYSNEVLKSLLNVKDEGPIKHLKDILEKTDVRVLEHPFNPKPATESTIHTEEEDPTAPIPFQSLQKKIWKRWDSFSRYFTSALGQEESYLIFRGTVHLDSQRTKKIELKFSMKNFQGQMVVIFIFSDISEKLMVDSLKQTLEYKSRLLASVSHELRTPLNGNINFISSVIKDPRIPASIKNKFLIPALRSARYLLSIINDILDFSQVQAQTLRLVNASKYLVATAKEAMELIEIQAQKKRAQTNSRTSNTKLGCRTFHRS
jgi:hypothetical protein